MTHHYTNCHSCANDTVCQRKEENNEEDDETPIGKTRGAE
jgi:hypothetical protein